MTTTVLAAAHVEGLLAALRAPGMKIGDGAAPEDTTRPYAVLYQLAGGSFDGPVDDPDADLEMPYQVTVVADTPEQARAAADRLRHALTTITVAGRSVMRNEPDGGLGAPMRDDTPSPSQFYLTPRFRLLTTPA